MGEIAEMMLDGTMDYETGEFNFDGEDGPGFPMTGAEAEAFRRGTGWGRTERFRHIRDEAPLYGFWREIGLLLESGMGDANEIATALRNHPAKVEAALDTMRKSGLTHLNHGPWKLTKRGRAKLEAGHE